MAELTLNTPDISGQAASQSAYPVGTLLHHTGNNKTYMIQGFCWLGATDEWGYIHSEVREDGLPGVPIVRPMSHIAGTRSNGEMRYKELNHG